jgi:hypothetical protein
VSFAKGIKDKTKLWITNNLRGLAAKPTKVFFILCPWADNGSVVQIDGDSSGHGLDGRALETEEMEGSPESFSTVAERSWVGRNLAAGGAWVAGVVWTSLGPLPWWVPGPTTRWALGTTRFALHNT